MQKICYEKFVSHLQADISSQLDPHYYPLLGQTDPSTAAAAYKLYSVDQSMTPRDVACIRLYHEIGKKFIGEGAITSGLDRQKNCWEKFLSANQTCKDQNALFCADNELDIELTYILDHAAKHINNMFWAVLESEESPLLYNEVSNKMFPVGGFSTGPGTCCGTTGTSTLEKYRDEWTFSTDTALRYLQTLRSLSKPLYDLPNYQAVVNDTTRMGFVPKDQNIDRGVIPQNNGDLFLQYPVGAFLEKMLNFSGIDLAVQQDLHRELAREGSLHDNRDLFDHSLLRRHPRYCTIDLVSASDIVGTGLTRYLFNIPMFDYMDMCRSPKLSGFENQNVSLEMMANMGNAFCFPLQTLIFSSIVRAVYWRLGLPLVLHGKPTYSVYGDDIIVDITAYNEVIRVLEQLEMIPNKKKSFSTGSFRESCGADFLDGYNIRPIYFETLDTDCDLFSLTNRLIEWGATNNVIFKNAVPYLLSFTQVHAVVPIDFGAHQGLRIPESLITSLPKGWNVVKAFVSTDNHDAINWKNTNARVILPRRTKNLYPCYQFPILDIDNLDRYIRVSDGEKSLFPLLRGGVRQKDENTYVVSTKKTRVVRGVGSVSIWNQCDITYHYFLHHQKDCVEYFSLFLREYFNIMQATL